MNQNKVDFLIVGAGLYGATCAYLLKEAGYSVRVIEKRKHIGGNIYTYKDGDIDIHLYGAHIFHTSDEKCWEFVNNFTEFLPYNHYVKANYKGKLYSLPFNLITYKEIFNTSDINEIKLIIEKEKQEYFKNRKPQDNLEDHIISQVGTSIYNILVKGYTEKQWNEDCANLSSSIIKRLPLRWDDNASYFNDKYVAMPKKGYTELIDKMLEGIDVFLNEDFNKNKNKYISSANKIIYTGCVDALIDNKFGPLGYRSLKFINRTLPISSYQKLPVINYTERNKKFTRIIEHKKFLNVNSDYTVVTHEYPLDYKVGREPYYPLLNECEIEKYNRYVNEVNKLYPSIYLGGRLGLYKYFDMDDTIIEAMKFVEEIKNEK